MTELEYMNAICYKLIDTCRESNAESMTIVQENVFKRETDEQLGTWKITVEKVYDTPPTP